MGNNIVTVGKGNREVKVTPSQMEAIEFWREECGVTLLGTSGREIVCHIPGSPHTIVLGPRGKTRDFGKL
jgi:hypothetical protein